MGAAVHVGQILRHPVKSMQGEQVEAVQIRTDGLEHDRSRALLDVATGRVVSAKRPARWGRILDLRATMSDGSVRVELPDGRALAEGDPDLEAACSQYLGREVRLIERPPDTSIIDEVWAGDLKGGARPYDHVDEPAQTNEGEMIEAPLSMLAPSRFFDLAPVHVLTTGTIEELGRVASGSDFDVARFRPNLVIDSDEPFGESAWLGRSLRLGSARLRVILDVPRCVMTTLPQPGLDRDRGVLRAVAAHHMADIQGRRYPCLGVYARVSEPGSVRVGDEVTVDPD